MQNTKLFECAGCGAPLDMAYAAEGVCRCKYCAYTNILSKDNQTEEVLLLLHDGDAELRNSAFERAYNAFKTAAELDPEESRAYFGMALANNRVKHIRDVVNNRWQSICFEVTEKRFTTDKNFSLALEYASTDEQRREYETRAREIDYIRGKFCELRESGVGYDTFICVKVSEAGGGYTQDSMLAMKLYDSIKASGARPFYSEKEIGDRVGEDYEALILYALFSAKSFILVCTNEDYLRTPWVENEYSRYYAMLTDKEKAKNSIMIVFNGTVIERIPGIPGKIQGVNLASFDASQKINQFVRKFSAPEEKKTKLCVRCGAENDGETKFCRECGHGNFANSRAELIKIREEQASREAEERRVREEEERRARAEEELRTREEFDKKLREAEERARADAEARVRDEADRAARERARKSAVEGAARNVKYCTACGTENSIGVKFCAECGETQFSDTNKKYCSACGTANSLTTKFCAECGGKQFVNSIEDAEKIFAERKAREEAEELAKYISDNFTIKYDILIRYKGTLDKVTVPSNIKSIYKEAFKGASLSEIIIPDSVTTIGESAFEGCTNLRRITFGRKIATINDNAFRGCSYLSSVDIPESIGFIGEGAFDDCSPILKITCNTDRAVFAIHGGSPVATREEQFRIVSEREAIIAAEKRAQAEAEERERRAREEEERLKRAEAERIAREEEERKRREREEEERRAREEREFMQSPYVLENFIINGTVLEKFVGKAEEIIIPKGIKTIAKDAFQNAKLITSVTVPEGVTEILKCAFYNCRSLKSITLPDSLEYIDNDVFNGCKSLEILNIPTALRHIGASSFFECNSLRVVDIKDLAAWCQIDFAGYCSNPGYVARALYLNGKPLTRLEVPEGVSEISAGAFEHCLTIKSVSIPYGLSEIGKNAFFSCDSIVEVLNHSSLDITTGNSSHGWVAYTAKAVERGRGNFEELDGFRFYTHKNTTYLVDYVGDSRVLKLPTSFKSAPYEIYKFAFYKNVLIESIDVPEGVTAVDKFAFHGCDNLTIYYSGQKPRSGIPKGWHKKSIDSEDVIIWS